MSDKERLIQLLEDFGMIDKQRELAEVAMNSEIVFSFNNEGAAIVCLMRREQVKDV